MVFGQTNSNNFVERMKNIKSLCKNLVPSMELKIFCLNPSYSEILTTIGGALCFLT